MFCLNNKKEWYTIDKLIIHVLLKNEEDTYCAKCCKTRNILERIFDKIPEFKQKIELSFENIESIDIRKKYGDVSPPAIIIGEHIHSEGHVPIMKKLAYELFELIKSTN